MGRDQRFDSLALEAEGRICVATLINGGIIAGNPRSISTKDRCLNKTPRRAIRRGVFPYICEIYSTITCPYIHGCGAQM